MQFSAAVAEHSSVLCSKAGTVTLPWRVWLFTLASRKQASVSLLVLGALSVQPSVKATEPLLLQLGLAELYHQSPYKLQSNGCMFLQLLECQWFTPYIDHKRERIENSKFWSA